MRGSSIKRAFARGVGKQIFELFLAAAIVPMVFTAWLAYHEFSRGIEKTAARALQEYARDYGAQVLARLELASENAAEVARLVWQGGVESLAGHEYLLREFSGIWIIDGAAPPAALPGYAGTADVSEVDPASTEQGSASLALTPSNDLLLLQAVPHESAVRERVLVFEPDAQKTWGTEQVRPAGAEFCVFTETGEMLSCSAEFDERVHEALVADARNRDSGFGEIRQGDERHLAVVRQILPDASLGASPMDVVALQDRDVALRSSADFRKVFLPAIALVLVLVGILSLNLIARSLVPLQHLTLAARQITAGNLNSRVRVRTGDEFEALADAFNVMAAKIGRQISTLEAMSGIDKMILSGTKFEEVSEDVVKHIIGLARCDAAAVIARDVDDPNKAKMISSFEGNFCHERIALPQDLGNEWCQPRQVSLAEVEPRKAPYKARFDAYGQSYVVLIPVVLNGDVKGILLLGARSQFDMTQGGLRRCIDLAGRFAVALASVEREETLYRQAHFDPLTGLPNRQLLKDRLEQYLVSARIDEHSGALLFLDLDRFKEINDVFGHSVGDLLLVQASERILSEVRDRDTVARLGGDEFVIVLPRVRNSNIVRGSAERLLDKLGEAFTVEGIDHYVSASIGIVLFPDDGDSVELLLKNADAAMYRAKEAGRSRFEFFSERLNAESRRKISLERELREAFYEHKLEVRYQPQFDIATGYLSGAEALLRWDHQADGQLSPEEFIPLAEESDLIVEIGAWVIERACRDLCEILDSGLHPGPMSINVSARQLRDSRFENDVLDPIRRYGIHPGYIQLEVTETTVAQNRDTAIDILENLRREGIRVAIDDFGTGYSSLSYLQQMPFDVIKIDKSFIQGIGSGVTADNICRTVIRMAEELGKKSIAEGVEHREQIDFLRENGCDCVQGYFYSKPLPQDEFLTFVEKQDFHTQRRKALEVL